jgi:transposase InsO family protein
MTRLLRLLTTISPKALFYLRKWGTFVEQRQPQMGRIPARQGKRKRWISAQAPRMFNKLFQFAGLNTPFESRRMAVSQLIRQEARGSVFEYIEVFYNRIRRHSSLDYGSPAEFEKRTGET